MTTQVQPLVYSIAEASQALRVNRITIARLIRDGELPAVRLGARVLIKCVDLDKLLKAKTTHAVPESLRLIRSAAGKASAAARKAAKK
ncbi:MAG: helix-turn-helix domain-containing protein [Alphaproteobacteria bacterium]|nr:helix-turn-helix domain-containing protein [Alphaproteobacteria bacterium]